MIPFGPCIYIYKFLALKYGKEILTTDLLVKILSQDYHFKSQYFQQFESLMCES